MKNRLIVLVVGIVSCLTGWAQADSISTRSIYVGLRNNKYAQIGYQDQCWSVGFENTLYVRNLKEQYVRVVGGASCNTGVWGIGVNADAFAGINYAGRYYDLGLKVGVQKSLGRVDIAAGVMPLYDSQMGYHTCYTVNAVCCIIQEASIVLDITNIPEYRMVEHRIVPGILFQYKKLWVRPEVSIPLSDNAQFTRVLLSFRYDFILR